MSKKPGQSKLASLPQPLSELKASVERSGAAIEDAYARVAGSFFDWFERLEDKRAEAKFKLRRQGHETGNGKRVS